MLRGAQRRGNPYLFKQKPAKSAEFVRFRNGLPRQCAHWLAMTGFFDSLRAARDIRAALCAVAVKNPLSAFFVENCGECSGVKRELAIYPNAL